MRLIGGILPWIGFRVVKIPCEVAAEEGITQAKLVDGSMDEVWVEAFEVEWLGVGITLSMKGVQ